MSNFKGMALYTKEDIGKALVSREVLQNKFDLRLSLAVNIIMNLGSDYHTSIYRERAATTKISYLTSIDELQWFEDNGYLSRSQIQGIKMHTDCFTKEHKDVKNLFNGGRDCYLNPEQARFVNYYKNIKLEEEYE